MITERWQTSPRQYEIQLERDLSIPVGGGIELKADLYRPQGAGRFPALLTISPYERAQQGWEMAPLGFPGRDRGSLEVGDFNFYVRRGYAFVIANMRGTHGSGGEYGNLHPDQDSIRDIAEAIGWIAAQPWCDGKVAMNGVSYFSVVQKRAAALKPAGLKAIFALYGWSDGYRDACYRGGILAHGFTTYWLQYYAKHYRFGNRHRREWGEARYAEAIARALADDEIAAVPALAAALRAPDAGVHPLIAEILLHPLYDDYYREREVDFGASDGVPGYFGADWGNFGLHLAGDVRAFQRWKAPKKLTIGPPVYLDPPRYQNAYQSLRRYDHWLKGRDTGLMDEPAVRVFVVGANEWKSAERWPIPDTQWTHFYLHAGGLLCEHEFWPSEPASTYEDSPFARGALRFTTPAMVENTEICGPIALKLYASTTDTEVLWFATLWHIDASARESLLTRGWLRGSQRALDPDRSRPWQPVHTHEKREPLSPGEVYEFDIELRPYAILLRAGERLALGISSADADPPANFLHTIGLGSVLRMKASHVTVFHDAQRPSYLLLPVTRGNLIGTFISGGQMVSP
ncbi:MAG: CocE/NonD family hydrolase [Burkholderiales bacterium]|nr:CocE/NonD family hydrolase [Burkholderiales bacterium]